MPISFVTTGFGGRPPEEDVVTLIAAKKYARAIELLKTQLQKRGANPSLRMQLADVLMLAGKKHEAVALLLPLADQYANDGFAAKAISVLKKLQKIEPGRTDVQERLARLIGEKQKEAVSPAATLPQRRPAVQMPGPDESVLEIGFAMSPISVSAEARPPAGPERSQATVRAEAPPAARIAPDVSAPALVEPTAAPQIRVKAAVPPQIRPAPLPVVARAEPVPAQPAVLPAQTPVQIETATPELDLGPPVASPEKAGSEFELPPDELEFPPAPVDAGALAAGALPQPAHRAFRPDDELGLGIELDADADATVAPVTLPQTGEDVLEVEPMLTAEPVPDEIPLVEPEAPAEPEPLPLLEALPEATATAASDALPIELDLSSAGPAKAQPAHALDAREVGIEDYDLMYEGEEGDEDLEIAAPLEPLAPEAPGATELSDGQFADELMSLVDTMFQEAPAAIAPAATAAASRGTQIVVSPLFRDFSVDEMVAVIEGLKLLTFERSDVILREGDAGSSLYTLSSGRVRAFRKDKATGKQKPIGDLKEGAFFGEMSVLTGEPRAATVVALTRCELLELDRQTLDQITKSHPHVWDVLRQFAAERARARS